MKQRGTITTRKRKGKNNFSYLIAWRDADGVQRSETIRDDEKAAKAKLKANIGQAQATVQEWTEHWLRNYTTGLKPATVARYRQHLARINQTIGCDLMSDLSSDQLQRMYSDWCRDGLTVQTANGAMGTLKTVITNAMTAGRVTENAAADVILSKPRKSKATSLTPQQLHGFMSGLSAGEWGDSAEAKQLHLIALTAAHTGLRRGEIVNLKWENVNLADGKLEVVSSKTDAGERTVDIGGELVTALSKHRVSLAMINTGLVAFGAPVFPGVDGERLSRKFGTTARRLGMPKGCTLHWLRHTHATTLLNAAIPLTVIAERLGHADASVTLRTYAHAMQGQQAEAAQVMDNVMNGSM
jgi:integrase